MKFNYETYICKEEDLRKILNSYGEKGWDLVGSHRTMHFPEGKPSTDGYFSYTLIFKFVCE